MATRHVVIGLSLFAIVMLAAAVAAVGIFAVMFLRYVGLGAGTLPTLPAGWRVLYANAEECAIRGPGTARISFDVDWVGVRDDHIIGIRRAVETGGATSVAFFIDASTGEVRDSLEVAELHEVWQTHGTGGVPPLIPSAHFQRKPGGG